MKKRKHSVKIILVRIFHSPSGVAVKINHLHEIAQLVCVHYWLFVK